MNRLIRFSLALTLAALAIQASAQIILYENEDFSGRSFNTNKAVNNFQNTGFNDRASSIIVLQNQWEVCVDARYSGQCIVLRPGRYPSLAAMGLNDRVSSVRSIGRNTRVRDDRYAPEPIPVYDNRRRDNERLFEADITSVRAVLGAPEQRCWVEREQVQQQNNPNVPGAVVGALIGGVLGHQVGGGRGKDLATAGGAVAGAYIGSNTGRDNNRSYTKDVQHCADRPASGRPEYWDVTYNFRGREHRIQMTTQPGATITVNAQGEPRA